MALDNNFIVKLWGKRLLQQIKIEKLTADWYGGRISTKEAMKQVKAIKEGE